MLAVRNLGKTHVVSPLLVEIRQAVLLIFLFAISKASVEHEVVGTRGKDVVLQCLLNTSIRLPEWQGPKNYATYNDQGSHIFFDNAKRVFGDRLEWMDNKNDLVIHNVTKSDEGKYQCLKYGLGEYRINLVIIEPVADVNTTSGLVSTPGSGHTGAIVAVVILILLFWIIIWTVGIIVVKLCKCKFLADMGKHLHLHEVTLSTVAMVLSCYILIGWAILVYKVMSENTNHEQNEVSADLRASEPLLPKNEAIEMEPQHKNGVGAPDEIKVQIAHLNQDTDHEQNAESAEQRASEPLLPKNEAIEMEPQHKNGIIAPYKTVAETGVEPPSIDVGLAQPLLVMWNTPYRTNNTDLVYIANCLGNGWESLASYLDISSEEMAKIKAGSNLVDRQKFDMLVEWRIKKGQNANIASLFEKMSYAPGVIIDTDELSKKFPEMVAKVWPKKGDVEPNSNQVKKNTSQTDRSIPSVHPPTDVEQAILYVEQTQLLLDTEPAQQLSDVEAVRNNAQVVPMAESQLDREMAPAAISSNTAPDSVNSSSSVSTLSSIGSPSPTSSISFASSTNQPDYSKVLSSKSLLVLAGAVPKDGLSLAIRLGVTHQAFQTHYKNNPYDVTQANFLVLLDWRQQNIDTKEEGLYKQLIEVLSLMKRNDLKRMLEKALQNGRDLENCDFK